MTPALLVFGFMAIVPSIFSRFFALREIRLAFLVCSMPAVLMSLYGLGRIWGEEELYDHFQVVELASPALSDNSDIKALVLGTDDKNLVILVLGENATGRPEPQYLLRSEVKTFRLVGISSINDFFCKRTQAISK